MTTVFQDAEGAIAAWINAQTGTLVGAGRPLAQGAHLTRRRSAANTCYALITLIAGSAEVTPEVPHQRARISAQIYGPTKEAAAIAAHAYANAVLALRGVPTAAGPAMVLCSDNLTGPLYAIDVDEPRYLVDADFYFLPA